MRDCRDQARLPVPDLFICDGNFFQLINRGWKLGTKKEKKRKKKYIGIGTC
jgi:hypothetical protein